MTPDAPTSPDRGVREARLRPGFGALYPGVDAEVWYNAATLAEHLRLRRAREGELPDTGPRPLSAEHFEFRGGERPVGGRSSLGRRPED
jgi:hypothetical protein